MTCDHGDDGDDGDVGDLTVAQIDLCYFTFYLLSTLLWGLLSAEKRLAKKAGGSNMDPITSKIVLG
jgi:hypothetical protein